MYERHRTPARSCSLHLAVPGSTSSRGSTVNLVTLNYNHINTSPISLAKASAVSHLISNLFPARIVPPLAILDCPAHSTVSGSSLVTLVKRTEPVDQTVRTAHRIISETNPGRKAHSLDIISHPNTSRHVPDPVGRTEPVIRPFAQPQRQGELLWQCGRGATSSSCELVAKSPRS